MATTAIESAAWLQPCPLLEVRVALAVVEGFAGPMKLAMMPLSMEIAILSLQPFRLLVEPEAEAE